MASSLPPICPWPFLDPSHKSNPKVSFANALKNGTSSSKFQPLSSSTINALQSINIPLHQLPTPSFKGDIPSIKISEEIYKESLLKCNSKLLGRLIFSKGQPPLKTEELRLLLSAVWSLQQPWKLTPRGKGFYSLHFDSIEDQKLVWMCGTISLKVGFFKIQQWCPDFMPNSFISSTAHVWVRFFDLPEEYWHPRLLLEIARGVGFPIRIDPATLDYKFGLYARVLVEVDFSSELPSKILVERKDFSFSINIAVEHPPPFCDFCGCIGHSISVCKKVKAHVSHKTLTNRVEKSVNVATGVQDTAGFKLTEQAINVPEGGFVLPNIPDHLMNRPKTNLVQNASVDFSSSASSRRNSMHSITHVSNSFGALNLDDSQGKDGGSSSPAKFDLAVDRGLEKTNIECNVNRFDSGQFSASSFADGTTAHREPRLAGSVASGQRSTSLAGNGLDCSHVAPLDSSVQILEHEGVQLDVESTSFEGQELAMAPTTFNDHGKLLVVGSGPHNALLSSNDHMALIASSLVGSHLAEDSNAAQRGSARLDSSAADVGCSRPAFDHGSHLSIAQGPTPAATAPAVINVASAEPPHVGASSLALIATRQAINADDMALQSRTQITQIFSPIVNSAGHSVGPPDCQALNATDGVGGRLFHATSNALVAPTPNASSFIKCQATDHGVLSTTVLSNPTSVGPSFVPPLAALAHESAPDNSIHSLAHLNYKPTSMGPVTSLNPQATPFCKSVSGPLPAKRDWASLADDCDDDPLLEPNFDKNYPDQLCTTNKQVLAFETSPSSAAKNLCISDNSSQTGSSFFFEENYEEDYFPSNVSSSSSGFSFTKHQKKALKKRERALQLAQDQTNMKLADAAIAKVMNLAKNEISDGLQKIRVEYGSTVDGELRMACFMQQVHNNRDAQILQIKRDYNLPETRSKPKKK